MNPISKTKQSAIVQAGLLPEEMDNGVLIQWMCIPRLAYFFSVFCVLSLVCLVITVTLMEFSHRVKAGVRGRDNGLCSLLRRFRHRN